jgi:hypothetical protein
MKIDTGTKNGEAEPKGETKPILTDLHKQLFKVKYEDGILHTVKIAERLGVSMPDMQQLSLELDKYLTLLLGKITPERLCMVCPECFTARIFTDPETGERACTECGTVFPLSVESADFSLPFDVTYAPSSSLATDFSLGGTLQKRDQQTLQNKNDNIIPLQTFKKRQPLLTEAMDKTGFAFDENHAYMLDTAEPRRPLVRRAKLKDIGHWAITSKLSPEDICKVFHASDVPLRAHKIKLLTCSENSELDNLLYQAYALSKKYKLDQDHVFNNVLGSNIRRMYNTFHDYGLKVPKRQLVNTVFYLTLDQLKQEDVIIKAKKDNLEVDRNILELNNNLSFVMKHMQEETSLQLP